MIEILQGRGEAYSSWSEKNVNDSDNTLAVAVHSVYLKDVDSKANAQEGRLDKGYEGSGIVEKLRMEVEKGDILSRGWDIRAMSSEPPRRRWMCSGRVGSRSAGKGQANAKVLGDPV